MKENMDKWIQHLRKRMEEAPVPYDPLQGWERMEQKILSHQRFARRRKGALWIAASFVAAAAVWLLFMVLGTEAPYTNGRLIHIPVLQSKAPEIVTVVSKPKQALAGIPFKVAEAQDKAVVQAQDEFAKARLSEDRDPVQEEAVREQVVREEAVQEEAHQEEAVHKEARPSKEMFLVDVAPRQKTQKKRVTLSASGLLGLQDKNRAVAVNRDNIFMLNEEALSYATTQKVNTTAYSGEPLFIASGYHSYEYKHKFPMSFAVYASLSIADRWALESGVRASRLASGIYTVSDPQAVPVYVSDQVLWYLGVPLRLRWDFIKSRYVTAYASVGGTLDKCISFSNTKTIDHDDLRYAASDIPLQWSVNAAAGIQYNIIEAISLFVEPGIAFFFDNESPVGTYWQSRPISFYLNAGIRFSFL